MRASLPKGKTRAKGAGGTPWGSATKIERRRAPSVVVLAAGASSRFHGTKQLAEIGRKSLVERALDSIPRAEVGEVVIVLGHDAKAVASAAGKRNNVKVVVN